MKYKLETIPVWDAVEEKSEACIFCALLEKAEKRYIDYYLGSSVMNPETRVKVNDEGFCPVHYSAMLEAEKPQSMSLIAHTHLMTSQEAILPLLRKLQKPGRGKKTKQQVKTFQSLLKSREQGCLICRGMERTLKRYLFSFVHLWNSDAEFRAAYESSGGICLHHFASLLEMAAESFSGEQRSDFISSMSSDMEQRLNTAVEDVHWMTQKYKFENVDKDWRNCRQAHRRAVHKEIGSVRIRDEG